jgi:hypothetical protein
MDLCRRDRRPPPLRSRLNPAWAQRDTSEINDEIEETDQD